MWWPPHGGQPNVRKVTDGEVVDEGTGGELPVARSRTVAERLREGSGAPQPFRGLPVQFGLQARRPHPQMGMEDLPEQRVEAVPGVPEVLDKRVLAVQPGQDGLGIGALRQRVRQLGTEALEDADPQQEVLRLGLLNCISKGV